MIFPLLQYNATPQPDLSDTSQETVVGHRTVKPLVVGKLIPLHAPLSVSQNVVLRFANTTFWWLLVAGAQLLLRRLIYERYFVEPQEQVFVDL